MQQRFMSATRTAIDLTSCRISPPPLAITRSQVVSNCFRVFTPSWIGSLITGANSGNNSFSTMPSMRRSVGTNRDKTCEAERLSLADLFAAARSLSRSRASRAFRSAGVSYDLPQPCQQHECSDNVTGVGYRPHSIKICRELAAEVLLQTRTRLQRAKICSKLEL